VRKETANDTQYLTGNGSRADEVCRMAKEWKSRVLTIFLFPRDSEKLQEDFFAKLDGMSLVSISERPLFDNNARQAMSLYAKENGIRETKHLWVLWQQIEPNTGYSMQDIRQMFEKWHDEHLRTVAFPQYDQKAREFHLAEAGPVGSGIEKLQGLIGLTETKALVANILDFAKAQELFPASDRRNRPSLHMVFTGNPGSAKTTVARLVAQILKENSVLENGKLVEVGRADLVGKFVGWTAPRVKGAFEKAKGSVLFIDEAYSLVDDRGGSYGDEAINTIVQEMENRRDDVVVIFAGYPDKMEGFLAKNPGLRSRIGFHVNFPDYTPEELCEILEHLAREDGLTLAEGVRERVYPMIEKAARVKEFGNGRYARNLLEKARMRQATRLVRSAREAAVVTEREYDTLTPEDFEEIRLSAAADAGRRIGFVG
jgi:AAA+ superfamily predicted ATPase